jgi:hypothetical protein
LNKTAGLTQGQMASLTGLHPNRRAACKTGKRTPKDHSVFGLDLPSTTRQAVVR